MAEDPTSGWSGISDATERFRRAWQDGQRPRIEQFLAEAAEPRRTTLFRELIRVEGELRRLAGEALTIDEYRQRFPDHERDIATTLLGASTATVSASNDAGRTVGGPMTVPPASTLPAELADHPDYAIVRELGQGGMGVVYLAHNRIMDRQEVLKVISTQIAANPEMTERFLREIRAVARLRHPNIVSAYSAVRCGGSFVFAMEYAEGLDLRRLVRSRGPIPVGHACNFIYQSALGLQHAHEEGMVHRDIKPSNLLLSHHRGKALVKVLDFGLSKVLSEQNAAELGFSLPALPNDRGEHLTCTGSVLGTPEFIAPEQITDAQNADIRADIYSLGCTLYYLLAGHPPFPSETIFDTLEAHRSRQAPLLDQLRPEVPAELSALVARMMAKEPSSRVPTPGEVAELLVPFYKKAAAHAGSGNEVWSGLVDLRDEVDDAVRPIAAQGLSRSLVRRPWSAAAMVVLACGLIVAWAAVAFRGAPAKRNLVGGPALTTAKAERRPAAGAMLDRPGPQSQLPPPRELAPSPPTPGVTGAAAPGLPETGPFPSDANPVPITKSPTPAVEVATPDSQRFQKIAIIRAPAVVLQARLISGDDQVLFETGGRDRALHRVDVKDTGKSSRLEAEIPAWSHLVLSRDGRSAVVAGVDGSFWNWDLRAGWARRLLRPGRGHISAVAVSPDGRIVAYILDGTIQFCEADREATVKKKGSTRRTGEGTELIAFAPDGLRLVSTHADRTIRVWDTKTRREIGYTGAPKPVTSLAVFPDGHRALIGLSGPTFVWDLEKGRPLRQAPGFGESIAVTADGRRALIGGEKTMRLWDLETGDELERGEHENSVLHVAFSSDERRAVSVTGDGVHVWDLPPGRAAGERPPVVEVIDFPREGIRHNLCIAVSPDGRRIVTGDYPSTARIWDRETGRLIRSFDLGGKHIRSVAVSPDGRFGLFGDVDGVVRLWDLATGDHREFLGHADAVRSVAFSPDGRRAYSAGGGLRDDDLRPGTDFAVRVWDLATGRQLRPLEGHKGSVRHIAVSADGRHLLTGGTEAVLILWDARAGREILRLRGHTGIIPCAAFLPDGRRAVSTSEDGTLRLWDLDSGGEISGHFKDPTIPGQWLAVSPDGHRLFMGGSWVDGRELRYWNLDTGRLIQGLRWEEYNDEGVFTPDGREVVWCGNEAILRLYRLTDLPDRPLPPPQRTPNPRKRLVAPEVPTRPNDRGKGREDPGKPGSPP